MTGSGGRPASHPTQGAAGEASRFVAPPDGGRVDQFLARVLPDLSRTRVQELIRDGRVHVDGRAVRPSYKLRGAEEISVDLPPSRVTDLAAEVVPFTILYQDQDVVVVDKPAGVVVHPARGNWSGTLVNGLLHAVPALAREGGFERPGIVHRIDKGTSGVLVVACHDLALRRLQAQFMIHSVSRRYLAVVMGTPSIRSGRIVSNLGRDPRNRLRFASVEEGGRRAVTHWRELATHNGFSLIECQLETGRTHQIRVHLSEAGLPIVGDVLYGGKRRCRVAGHEIPLPAHTLLHAAHLGFEHPVSGARLEFETLPPEDFRAFCAAVGLPVEFSGSRP